MLSAASGGEAAFRSVRAGAGPVSGSGRSRAAQDLFVTPSEGFSGEAAGGAGAATVAGAARPGDGKRVHLEPAGG